MDGDAAQQEEVAGSVGSGSGTTTTTTTSSSTSRKLHVMQWGYLPASSPDRLPLLLPTLAPLPLLGQGWKAICSGGCGFALAISECGRLNTWGSTCDLGQSYVTAGKHEDRPEPFPLPSDHPVRQAAAGWAHCVVVTDNAEVYTWGWRECVPSSSKFSPDQSRTANGADKDGYGAHTDEKVVGGDEGSLPMVRLNPADVVDNLGSISPDSVGTGLKSKMINPLKDKVPSSVEKVQGSLSLQKKQSIKSTKVPSTDVTSSIRKLGEAGTKKRRIVVDPLTSSDSSTMADDENVSVPPCLVPLHPGVKIVSVAAGGRHTLALSDIGQVWGWGYGGEGQLGLGFRIRIMLTPHPVPCFGSGSLYLQGTHTSIIKGTKPIDATIVSRVPGRHIKAVACGGRHSAALTDAGALLTFGWGLYGQCGQGSTDDELSPCYISSLGGVCVKSVAAGLWHTVCTTESGDVYSFGGNQFGQLGTGGDKAETFPRLLEAPILENVHALSVSCGARHTAICTDEGRIFSWGWNKYGQLGLGDTLDRSRPAEVSLGGNYAKEVACGWWHTLVFVQSKP